MCKYYIYKSRNYIKLLNTRGGNRTIGGSTKVEII